MLLIYRRVSTDEQAKPGRSSLEIQEEVGRGFAMTKGVAQFDMSIYTDDGVSATIPLRDRPDGKRLLDDVKSGDTIFASKLDRMFRSANDALAMSEYFKEKKINLVLYDLGSDPVNSNGISQFFFTVIAAVAQLERTMIKERLMGGKRAKKEKGGHIGGRTPYGYRVVGAGRDARLEKDAREQKVLTAVQEWLKERAEASLAETVKMLDERGLKSRTGRPFFPMQVARIMKQVKHAAQ